MTKEERRLLLFMERELRLIKNSLIKYEAAFQELFKDIYLKEKVTQTPGKLKFINEKRK